MVVLKYIGCPIGDPFPGFTTMHPHSLSHTVSKPQGHSPLWPAISSNFQGLANLFFKASLHPPLTIFP